MLNNTYYIILCFCLLLLSGCWDVVNIEERGFVIGTAIDTEGDDDNKSNFSVTNQLVVPAGMISPQQEMGEGEEAFVNYTTDGNSIYEMEEKVASISSKSPYYEHLAVLIISEDVAKQEHTLSNLLDTYIRDVHLRRDIYIVVAEGEAKKTLEFYTPNYELPTRNIEELLEKGSHHVGFLQPEVAGDIDEYHFKNVSYVLPYIRMNDYLEYETGAVFHGSKNKMVGRFNEDEMQGLSMIKGEQTKKIVEFPYKDETLSVDINRLSSKIKVIPRATDDINVDISINIDGIIKEAFHQEDYTQSQNVKAVQKALSQEIKERIEKILIKAQKDLGTDVFGIWQQLETKHHDMWKKVRGDWEEGEYYFKDVDFNVNVISDIYSAGTSSQTK